MSDGILYKKMKELIATCEQIDYQNEINRAQLQADLSRRFRLSNSEIGQVLSDMMEKDIIEKENRYKIRVRR